MTADAPLNVWHVVTARPGLLVYERPDPLDRPERVVVTGHSAATARDEEEGDHAAIFAVSAAPGVLTREYIGLALLRRGAELLAESDDGQVSDLARVMLEELAPLFGDATEATP